MYILSSRLAREFPNCRTRCLVFDVPRAAAEHMNEFRTRLSGGAIKAVPSIAYNTFNAGFQAPVAAAEGLASVEHVRFEPAFQSARERALFLQFL